MSADEPRRTTLTERHHELVMAVANRQPSAPEHAIEVSTTTIRPAGEKAYRVHNWTITIRGADADECDKIARRLDDGLAAKYAHELDDGVADALEATLAAQNAKGAK